MPTENFIALKDTSDFDEFWAENAEAFDGIDRQTAFDLACNQSLCIGGGAAPAFRIGFVD